jgi:hypothetical protein
MLAKITIAVLGILKLECNPEIFRVPAVIDIVDEYYDSSGGSGLTRYAEDFLAHGMIKDHGFHCPSLSSG